MKQIQPDQANYREQQFVITQLQQGRNNAIGYFELTPGTSTLIEDDRINGDGILIWMPLTEDASGIANMWIESIIPGSALIGHSNIPGGNPGLYVFRYLSLGG